MFLLFRRRQMRLIVALVIFGCIGMLKAGDFGSGKSFNISKGAGFISLARGATSFEGYINDESSKYHVKDLCFGGLVKIGGIRKEGDDSSWDIEIKTIKEMTVLNPNYQSTETRHAPKGEKPLFVKTRVTFATGASVEYLFPHDMAISGVDIKTGTGIAFYLRKINGVKVSGKYFDFKKDTVPAVPSSVPAKTSWWESIISFG